MSDRRNIMTVHVFAVHVTQLFDAAEALRSSSGFEVATHSSQHRLIEALQEDQQRGAVIADLEDVETSGADLIEALQAASGHRVCQAAWDRSVGCLPVTQRGPLDGLLGCSGGKVAKKKTARIGPPGTPRAILLAAFNDGVGRGVAARCRRQRGKR